MSIARRLQDPLAELVKIDPCKSIGVGQYQHDVNQSQLARSLEAVVRLRERRGGSMNTASPALLTRVSGLTASVAANIVAYRDQQGAFKSRDQLKKVPRLGDKRSNNEPPASCASRMARTRSTSAVHPEAYPPVQKFGRHPARRENGNGRRQTAEKTCAPKNTPTKNLAYPPSCRHPERTENPAATRARNSRRQPFAGRCRGRCEIYSPA